MRLGEGTGAALAAVLAKTALYLHTTMATFDSAADALASAHDNRDQANFFLRNRETS